MKVEDVIAIAERALSMAVEIEREACAKLCDAYLNGGGAGYAAAIRARGNP